MLYYSKENKNGQVKQNFTNFEGSCCFICNTYFWCFICGFARFRKCNVSCFSCTSIFMHCKISLAISRKKCVQTVPKCCNSLSNTLNAALYWRKYSCAMFWFLKHRAVSGHISLHFWTIHQIISIDGVKFNLCIYCQNIEFITVISFLLNYDIGI